MWTVGRIEAAVRKALARAQTAREQVRVAMASSEIAREHWQQATAGSWQSAAGAALARAEATLENLGRAAAALDGAALEMSTYLQNLTGTASSAVAPQGSSASAPSEVVSACEAHPQVVEAARRRLGRGVPGAQATGVWIRDDGTTEDLHSGPHPPWYAEAQRELRRLGRHHGDRLARLATHVEVRFVLRMRAEGIREATLVMDRPPCAAPPRPPARSAATTSCPTSSDPYCRPVPP